jgi:hypothetical protein
MQPRRDRLWRFRTLRRGDYAAILMVIALAVAAAIGLVEVPYGVKGNAPGFGPEWDCSYAGQGEPVCIKKNAGNSN